MANNNSSSNGDSAKATANNHKKQEVTTTIEDLYKYFGILADAKQDAGKNVDVYLKLLAGTKAGIKEKQLASQFITRFFNYFPKEMALAIDAIFDLCEDDDVNIRKAAIKDLAILCKDCPVEHLNRIADILTQLLQTEDQQEFIQVQSSLLIVFKQNPKSCLNEIFNQINTAELEEVRKRAIKFLVSKIPTLLDTNASTNSSFNKEFEDLVVKNVKQVLVDVDAEEFILFIRLLTSLPSMSTLTGRQDLVNIIMAQSELDKPFLDIDDVERLMILLSCIQQAIPLFSKNVPSTKYVKLYLDNVIGPTFPKMTDENTKFEILKAFAELCIHYNPTSPLLLSAQQTAPLLVASLSSIEILYNLLIEYLPKPIETETAKNESDSSADDEKFNFSYVECLLYSFHILLKYHSDFFNTSTNSAEVASENGSGKEKLRDFRLRLQYFAKGTQNYIKELKNSLNSNLKEDEQNKIRSVALKVTTNIDSLIKDFFHNPPTYKTNITLSWKSEQKQQENKQAAAAANSNNKRSLSVSNVDNNDQFGNMKKKPERGIYHPPSGKYSKNGSDDTPANGNNFNFKRRTISNDPIHLNQQQQNRAGGLFNNRNVRRY